MEKRYNHHGSGAVLKTEEIPGITVIRDVSDAEIAHARCIQGFRLKTEKNHSHVRT